MRIQTFRASTIQDALQLVRESLGPDASVLNTRQVRRGFFSPPQIEVEASRDLVVPSRLDQFESRKGEFRESGRTVHHLEQSNNPTPRGLQLEAEKQNPNPFTRLEAEGLKESNGAAITVLNELIAIGIPAALAEELLSQACQKCDSAFRDDAWLIRGQIVEIVAERLRISPTIPMDASEQRLIAFVGPAGSGKTTLLSKMAFHAYSESQLEIGIIAMDSWRSGASEQLLHLADLVSAQIQAVDSLTQLTPALQRLRECDLVLLDTSGCSPTDEVQMQGLGDLLRIAQPHEVHFTMSANSAPTYVQLAIEKYSEIGATQLDITHLDEAVQIGQWMPCLLEARLPVACLSHGRISSEDLVLPSSRRFASLILGQSQLYSGTPYSHGDSTSPPQLAAFST